MYTQTDTLLRFVLLAEHSRHQGLDCMQTNLPCAAILHATMLKPMHASCRRLAAKHVDEGGSAAPPPPSGSTPAGHDDGLGPILPDFGSLLHADKPDARRYAKLHV
jgi:hypothetical protein